MAALNPSNGASDGRGRSSPRPKGRGKNSDRIALSWSFDNEDRRSNALAF